MLRRVMMAGGGGPPPPTDPYWSSVVSLLHFDGANGSTTFVDEKITGPGMGGWSPFGGAEISTTGPKFGSGCLPLNGTNQGINHGTTAQAKFDFGASDFTIEMWINPSATITTRQALYTRWATNGVAFHVTDAAKLRGFVTIGGTTYECTGTTNVTAGSYHHIAMVRDGVTLRLYLNGGQDASVAVSGSINAINQGLYVGSEPLSRWFNGRIDDFRVTNGVCRYPDGTSFALPTSPFPNS